MHIRRRLFNLTVGAAPEAAAGAGLLTQAAALLEARTACLGYAIELGLPSLVVVPSQNNPTRASLPNLLAEVFLAVVAAVALQGGMAAARALLLLLLPAEQLTEALDRAAELAAAAP